MATKTTSKTSSRQPHARSSKEPTPHWFVRYLRPVPAASQVNSREKVKLYTQVSLGRPRTAPSTGTASTTPPMPPHLLQLTAMEGMSDRKERKEAPPRPQRPNSGVLRDVNAWLDASKPSSPLMGGLPYWRDGVPGVHDGQASNVQYAIPVVREPEDETCSAASSQQLKSLYRRAKKMQVRMPSLQRTRSQRATVQKTINRRSNSTRVMGLPYEETRACSPPKFLARFGSTRRPATANNAPETATRRAWLEVGHGSSIDLPLRRGTPANMGSGGPDNIVERSLTALPGRPSWTRDGLRTAPATAFMPREDSMGSMSDAPTYFSGPPPPSYRSRTASILTTSSFGCVDGMNPEYRQLSQQRAQEKRSVKGKLKKFAQKCTLTK